VLPADAVECGRCRRSSTVAPVGRERAFSEASWFIFITALTLAMVTGLALVLEVIHGV
jgi:hypothetical protein